MPLYFVRHGKTTWNQECRMLGWSDVQLNKLGYHEARRLARAIGPKGIDIIFTSPLQRTKNTANLIREKQWSACRYLELDALKERNFLHLEGKKVSTVRALLGLDSGEDLFDKLDDYAEPYEIFYKRVKGALCDVVLPMSTCTRTLLVGHSGTWRVISAILDLQYIKPDHCQFIEISDGALL